MSAAISPTETHAESEERKPRSFGWYGMVFFLASEAIFFANLIASYLYLRIRATGMGEPWPPKGATLEVGLILINTIILLSSSFPMHFAARAIARGNRRGLTIGLILTVILGSIFLSIQAWEYTHADFTPSTGVFGSTFYTLTGFHGAHVTAGVLFLLICFFRSLRGDFTKDRHFAVSAAEMYWHFVDVVWVFLFLLLYII
ncbi:MAG TPA: cytochrome c oxidase subunit 3 [Ktedonobacterales bacterium]|nr:cytochrome c oxidase subunit 3 [Ktedonobacterales bacterium]